MDFDDLDEAIADRAAAGELDDAAALALGAVEAPGDYRGGYLWPIPRNKQFPGLNVLPKQLQDAMGELSKVARMRLFVFYGAGDSFPFWAQWMLDTPEWVEAAVYEWPSHGSREEEKLPEHVDGLVADAMEGMQAALKHHVKDGPLEGAPFALLGHSIGVRIMLGVAERCKKTLGLEPSAVFVLDRAAPQHRLTSEFGAKLLDEDAQEFIRIFNPQVYSIYMKSKERAGGDNAKERQMLQMWMDDIKFQNQTKSDGFHLFKCPVHVFVAMHNWYMDSDEVQKAMNPEDLAAHLERCSILNSKPSSGGLWDYEMYEDWQGWAAGGHKLHQMETDHTNLKRFPPFLKALWAALAEFQAKT